MNIDFIRNNLNNLNVVDETIRKSADKNLTGLYNNEQFLIALIEIFRNEENISFKKLILSVVKSFINECFNTFSRIITNEIMKSEDYKNNLILVLCDLLEIESNILIRKNINYILGTTLKIKFPTYTNHFLNYIRKFCDIVSKNIDNLNFLIKDDVLNHFKSINSILKLLCKSKYLKKQIEFRNFINQFSVFLIPVFNKITQLINNDLKYILINKIFDELILSIICLNISDKNYEDNIQSYIKEIYNKFVKILNFYVQNKDNNKIERYIISWLRYFGKILDTSPFIFHSFFYDFLKFWINFIMNNLIDEDIKKYGYLIFYKITKNYFYNNSKNEVFNNFKNEKDNKFYNLQETCHKIYTEIFNNEANLNLFFEFFILKLMNEKTEYISYDDLINYINTTNIWENKENKCNDIIYYNGYNLSIQIFENLFKRFDLMIVIYNKVLNKIYNKEINNIEIINSILILSILIPNILNNGKFENNFNIKEILEYLLNLYNTTNNIVYLRNLVYIYFYWIKYLDNDFNTLMFNNLMNWIKLNDIIINYEIINCLTKLNKIGFKFDYILAIIETLPIFNNFLSNIDDYSLLWKISAFITTMIIKFKANLNVSIVEKFRNLDIDKFNTKNNSMIFICSYSKILKSILIYLNVQNYDYDYFYEICIKFLYSSFKNFDDGEISPVLNLWNTLIKTIPYKEAYMGFYNKLFTLFINFHEIIVNFDNLVSITSFIDLIKEYIYLNIINNSNEKYNISYFINYLYFLYKKKFEDLYELISFKITVLKTFYIIVIYLIEIGAYNIEYFYDLIKIIYNDLILIDEQKGKKNIISLKNQSIKILNLFLVYDFNNTITLLLNNLNIDSFLDLYFKNLKFVSKEENIRLNSIVFLMFLEKWDFRIIYNYLNLIIMMIIPDIDNQTKNKNILLSQEEIYNLKLNGVFSQRNYDFEIKYKFLNYDLKTNFKEKIFLYNNKWKENNMTFPQIKPDCYQISLNNILNS